MALRITGGRFRSRLLDTPLGQNTRPTRSLVREAAFNMLQGQFEGGCVLDLFAGSGALGFEALSRGAAHAIFVDQDRRALAAIKANINSLGVQHCTTLIAGDWRQALGRLSQEGQAIDLVFLDPPYKYAMMEVLDNLVLSGILRHDALVLAELGAGAALEPPVGMMVYKQRSYGQSKLWIMKAGDVGEEGNLPGQL